ncbi:MAG: class I SAM-dependent methyltransferase [Acidimicrobiales bacterium]
MRPETAGFEKSSHAYERGRPGYPEDAVAWIVALAGLGPPTTVVDLGAGTGKLTRQLVGQAARVIAVEPLAEMRARLTEALPAVAVSTGLAEATGLDDAVADVVTVAQAFHWFAGDRALAEIHRVLKPAGLLFLLWNRRDLSDPVQASISRLTLPHLGTAPSYGSGHWQEVMSETQLFERVAEYHCDFVQELDRPGIVARVASTSYIANLRDEVRHRLLDEVAALVPENGRVPLGYITDVYAYRSSPD